jgi:phage antirepressor YoqD-like protein
MLKTWPLGIGDEVFGEPVLERQLHSVRTAANSTGVDQRRLFKMLLASGMIKGTDAGEPDLWEVFDAQSAEQLLKELTQLVPASNFAALIGAPRSQFDLLVSDGVVSPALPDSNTKSVWNPQHGVDFLDSILIKSTQLRQVPLGWEHISKAAQRLKIGPGEIIKAIKDGKIVQVGNYTHRQGYGAIYVNHSEVFAVLGGEPPPAISIENFAKSVGVNQPSRMRMLVMNGHINATKMQNPRTKADQFYFTSSDSKAFHAEFLTPRTMSIAYSRSWQSIGAELKAKNIRPFAPDGEDYGSLFRREEIDAALQ